MSKFTYDTQSAADYLSLKKGTLEVWRSLGRGPTYSKLGGRVVYTKNDLDWFISSCKVQTVDTYEGKPFHLNEEGKNGI